MSRFSRITSSKNTRPDTGRSSISVERPVNQPPVAAEAWDAEGSTPPRPRPLEPPTGLTVGDIVRLDVKPSPPRTDLQVVSGTLKLRHPGGQPGRPPG